MLLTFTTTAFGEPQTLKVKSGEKIADALKNANKGDTILIEPGIYFEALHIDKEDIKIRGIIKNGKFPEIIGKHKLNDGIIVSGSGFSIENILIRDFKGNGITTQAANNITIRRIVVKDTGIYGIYPTLGQNILIEDTVTSGIEDAAIYIGMCKNVDVIRNVTFESVAGIEAENSENVLIEANKVHDNSGGILVFTLPGLPVKFSKNIVVRGNFIFNNNHHNFAPGGSIVGNVPPGSGVIILSADDVTLEDNIIENNALAGIIVVDQSIMPNSTPDPDMDPVPDRIKILRNFYRGNGDKNFGFLTSWTRFVVKAAMAEGSPEGVDSAVWPDPVEIYSEKNVRESCYDPRDGQRTKGTKDWSTCDESETTRKIVSMISDSLDLGPKRGPGEQVFAAVCAGCHAMSIRAVGPPVTEIQQKHKGRPENIAAFAKAPVKVRKNYPQMPSQAHLGDEKLKAVAEYILNMKP